MNNCCIGTHIVTVVGTLCMTEVGETLALVNYQLGPQLSPYSLI